MLYSNKNGLGQEVIGPVLRADHQTILADKIEETLQAHEELDKTRRLRSEGGSGPLFFVGQIFVHKKYSYPAIVIGWDVGSFLCIIYFTITNSPF